MPCERYQQNLIEAAATGAALPNDARMHVEGCLSCRAALADEQALLAAVDASLRHNSDAEPSPSFIARVREAVETEPVSSHKHQFALGSALVAATTLVVLGISLTQRFRSETHLSTRSTMSSVAVVPAMREEVSRGSDTTTKDHSFAKKSYRSRTDAGTNSGPPVVSIARNSPEVLVPAEQHDLLLRYLERLNVADSVSSITPSLAHQVNVKHEEIPPIEIAELVIKPLSGPDTD